jgi:hypothetical protein
VIVERLPEHLHEDTVVLGKFFDPARQAQQSG